MHTIRFIFLFVIILFVSNGAQAQIRVLVKFNEIPNLTYQLDCVSDLPVNCSRGNLGELWKREFLKTDEDRRLLKEWARRRDLYSETVQLSKAKEGDSDSINLFEKIRIAGFQAENVDDYLSRLNLLMAPADRGSLELVVRHFEPPFKAWWDREATLTGNEFAKQTDVLLRSPKIAAPVNEIYNFYAPVLPANYEITFNLFYIPTFLKESSNGQQIENYSLMEFVANERPENRIDIAVHELCHFFYENRSPENKAKLENKFYAANRAGAVPALNLLNEGLAAAFGNGIIARAVTPAADYEKYLAAKNSFYNNDSIDRAAKAMLPLVDESLKNKLTINDPAFADNYIAALEKSFGADLVTPKLYLSEEFLFIDEKYGISMRRDVRRMIKAASFYSVEANWDEDGILDDYTKHSRLNSLFIVHPDNIGELVKNKIITDAQAKEIQAEYDAKQQVLYNAERAPYTYVYIAIAKDADSAKKLIETLANAPQFNGIYKNGL